MNNYKLNTGKEESIKSNAVQVVVKKLWPLIEDEQRNVLMALFTILINSSMNLIAPAIIAHTIDTSIKNSDFQGVLVNAGILLCMYLVGLVASYLQTKWMGGVGQRVLFNLRNSLFKKIQSLPVDFFNQNKAGDLISRLNNDTDKLNQFFSQSLMQFLGNLFIMFGAGIFLISLNWQLGIATLMPALLLLILTKVLSGWVKSSNSTSMKALGNLSSEIQESLNNFKVIIAFNRRDYFRQRFSEVNKENHRAAVKAGIANGVFVPLYGFSSNIAQLIVIIFGIYLIINGSFTLGLLISFLAYANNFYNPLRHLAALWANFQVAMAGWDRISEILALESNLNTIESQVRATEANSVLAFKKVSFNYPNGKNVLKDIDFNLEPGKTYALVGPTGGGKTTTASIMARLYDPTTGQVFLNGKDIRSYENSERTKRIGFILQEPFLFTGTVKENILYGNDELLSLAPAVLEQKLKEANLDELLKRFDQGLETPIVSSADGISLGQKQILAFIRAVLRNPDLLILDEATANIDTITEQALEQILQKLPKTTTRVIIAHRLNTIENADEIFFINNGEVTKAGSFDHAVEMLLHGKRSS